MSFAFCASELEASIAGSGSSVAFPGNAVFVMRKSDNTSASLSGRRKFGILVFGKYPFGLFSQLMSHCRFTFVPMPSRCGIHCRSYPSSLWHPMQFDSSMSFLPVLRIGACGRCRSLWHLAQEASMYFVGNIGLSQNFTFPIDSLYSVADPCP